MPLYCAVILNIVTSHRDSHANTFCCHSSLLQLHILLFLYMYIILVLKIHFAFLISWWQHQTTEPSCITML